MMYWRAETYDYTVPIPKLIATAYYTGTQAAFDNFLISFGYLPDEAADVWSKNTDTMGLEVTMCGALEYLKNRNAVLRFGEALRQFDDITDEYRDFIKTRENLPSIHRASALGLYTIRGGRVYWQDFPEPGEVCQLIPN